MEDTGNAGGLRGVLAAVNQNTPRTSVHDSAQKVNSAHKRFSTPTKAFVDSKENGPNIKAQLAFDKHANTPSEKPVAEIAKPVALQNLKKLNRVLRTRLKEIEVDVEERFDSLDLDIQAKHAEIDALKQKVKKLSESEASLTGQLKASEESGTEYRKLAESARQQLQDSLEAVQSELLSARKEQSELQSEMATLKMDYSHLEVALNDERKSLSEVKHANARLLQEISDLKDVCSLLEEKQSVLNEEHAQKVNSMSNAITALETRENQHVFKISELEVSLSEDQLALTEQKAKVCEKEDALSLLGAQLSENLIELTEKCQTIEELENSRLEQEAQYSKMDTEWNHRHHNLKQVNALLLQSLSQERDSVSALETREKELESEVFERANQLEVVEHNLASTVNQLQISSEDLEQSEVRRQRLRNLNSTLMRNIQELRANHTAQAEKYEKLEAELKHARSQSSELQQDKSELSYALTCRENELKCAQQANVEATEREQKLREENQQLVSQVDKQSEQLNDKQSELDASVLHTAELERSLRCSKEAELEIQKEYAALQNELEDAHDQAQEERNTLMRTLHQSHMAVAGARDKIEELALENQELHLNAERINTVVTVVSDALDERSERVRVLETQFKTSESERANLEAQLIESRQQLAKMTAEKKHAESLLSQTRQLLTLLQNGLRSVRSTTSPDSRQNQRPTWMQRALSLASYASASDNESLTSSSSEVSPSSMEDSEAAEIEHNAHHFVPDDSPVSMNSSVLAMHSQSSLGTVDATANPTRNLIITDDSTSVTTPATLRDTTRSTSTIQTS